MACLCAYNAFPSSLKLTIVHYPYSMCHQLSHPWYTVQLVCTNNKSILSIPLRKLLMLVIRSVLYLTITTISPLLINRKKMKGKCFWQPQPLGLVRTLAFTAVYRKADEKFIYSWMLEKCFNALMDTQSLIWVNTVLVCTWKSQMKWSPVLSVVGWETTPLRPDPNGHDC